MNLRISSSTLRPKLYQLVSVEQDAFGVDEERAAQGVARVLVVDADARDTFPVRSAPMRYLTFAALSRPSATQCTNSVSVLTCDDVAADLLEPLVLLCQSSELGRSDEGEVGRVEEDRPAAASWPGERELPRSRP
ncbi:MAG: hypothetical protein U0599_06745 [Vicinamibacteria bacterium]